MKTGVLLLMIFLIAGCGVKGDPLPPEKPVDIGRGRPTYKRAAEKIRVQPVQREDEPEDDQGEEDEER